mgnify:CR=1 FL=1
MAERYYVTDSDLSERFTLYTRANVGEVFPDPVTPLTSSTGMWYAELGWRDAWERMGAFTHQEFPPDQFSQLGVVGGITATAGVAGRVDAGCAAQGVDRESGVVGQRRQARDAGGVTRLDQGVFDEGQAGFLGFDIGEVALRADGDAVTQHGLEFSELALVVAGEHQLTEGQGSFIGHRGRIPAGSSGCAPWRLLRPGYRL